MKELSEGALMMWREVVSFERLLERVERRSILKVWTEIVSFEQLLERVE